MSAAWDINDLYSQTTLIKARQLVDKQRVTQDEKPTVFHVQGSTNYRVQVEPVPIIREGAEADLDISSAPWLTCTCPNGMARGGRPSCYHTAAVLLLIAEHPEILEPDPDDEIESHPVSSPHFGDDPDALPDGYYPPDSAPTNYVFGDISTGERYEGPLM